ncbi:MAG: fibronectin type III domain-containing protein, partial [Acidobacteria bacterium]|nr:fibronectin type III domain-containing protein [Acidobacteriota bacterium]
MRFGTGSQNSINASGNLEQPWYKGIDGNTYKLTFSNYPLDIAFGGSTGTNWTGSFVTENPPLGSLVIDYSGFNITATGLTGGGVRGWGTVVVRGTINGPGLTGLELQHTYILGRYDNFLKVITQVRNTTASAFNSNVHMWIGTRDDFVGNDDVNTKWKGNVIDGVFTRLSVSNPAQPAQMVQVTNANEGVLFYSTTPETNMSLNSCCQFSNAYNTNPTSSVVTVTNDGSYALYQKLGKIAANGSRFVTWYYAAGSLVNLAAVSANLAAAAAPSVLGGNGQVTVSWTQPSTETTINSYVIRYSSNNGTSWTTVNVSTIPNPLSQVVTGLVNGTPYIFQVA